MAEPHVVRPAPELVSAGDAAAHYDDHEASRYDAANAKVQEELAGRCCEMLGLSSAAPSFLLDAGCGSCLCAREVRRRNPLSHWLGLDVSAAMLQRARDGGVLADGGALVLCDLAQRLPLRADCRFDAVVSVSALQWLCRAKEEAVAEDAPREHVSGGNKRHAKRALERRRKLARTGELAASAAAAAEVCDDEDSPLAACLAGFASRLVPGGRFALQVYPSGCAQAAEMEAALRATPGLARAGLVADLPHRAVVAKRFLCGETRGGCGGGEEPCAHPSACPLSWPMVGGCALWWCPAAGLPEGGEWREKLVRWHAREAGSLARLHALSPETIAALPPHKQRALADEQLRGRAKAGLYSAPDCCAAWREAMAAASDAK